MYHVVVVVMVVVRVDLSGCWLAGCLESEKDSQ